MSAFSIIFAASILVLGSEALKLPDYITPCSRKDPNFNKCALEHGREAIPKLLKGDPEYGVPILDPLFIKEITMKLLGLILTVRDTTAEGAKDFDLQDVRFDFENLTLSIQTYGPLALFRGQYEMSGTLLNIPMSGKGEFNVSLVNTTVKYTEFYKATKKSDGKTYLQPLDYTILMEPKRGFCYFGGMFNGNKLLGDAMNNFLNENFLLIIQELAQPTFNAIATLTHQALFSWMEKVPYDELFTGN